MGNHKVITTVPLSKAAIAHRRRQIFADVLETEHWWGESARMKWPHRVGFIDHCDSRGGMQRSRRGFFALPAFGLPEIVQQKRALSKALVPDSEQRRGFLTSKLGLP